MIRSLYSGISGLRTHQVGLDVTANNIANVNTVAFKAGRATFKESMVQMLQGPSRPAGNQGGRNPMQLGLGVGVGSIDTMLRQGNLQTTGQITDLALEGRAYFAYSRGSATYYSRNGGLQMDSHGYLVSPTNGFRLQGKMAGADGNYDVSAMIGDIRVPWGDKAPARATDLMTLACNLNSDSHAMGTVTHTSRFLASAGVLSSADMASRAKLTDLFDEGGNSLGIKEGDVLSARVADPNMPTFAFRVEKYPVTDAHGNLQMQIPTLEDFMQELEAYLNGMNDSRVTGASPTMTMREFIDSYAADMKAGTGTRGSIQLNIDPLTGGINVVNDSGANINGLQVNSSRQGGSNSFVTGTFNFPSTIGHNKPASGSPSDPDYIASTMGSVSHTTPSLRIPAALSDKLLELFDATGRSLGFTHGDEININGMIGGNGGKNKSSMLLFNGGYDSNGIADPSLATTMEELLLALRDTLGLPPTDGTVYDRPSITIKSSADLTNDGIPIGAIVLRGQPEIAFALTSLSVVGKQGNPNNALSPTRFGTNMQFIQTQAARNTGVWTTSEIVYDDSGAEHNVSMTFTHTGVPGEWLWEITTLGGDEVILGGSRGRITFALDGTPSSFTFDDGSSEFRFDPRNGANEVAIKLDVGSPGSTQGITQYKSDNTTSFKSQNGYPMGKLSEITIDENGEITGMYSNGISKALAQIYVAEFNNPAGLLKMGDSMFGVSNNSGDAVLYQPNVGSTTKIKPGALEMSNVELETEFTNMITIQRGYQASARVISTSDQMLQELVQLVR